MASKDTNKKNVPTRKVTSKAELKDVVVDNPVIKTERMMTPGSKESTKTTLQLRNGTVKEVFGERKY
jgi:hypothetical protein